MDGLVQSNFVFLNLEPVCNQVKAKMPTAYKALFNPATDVSKRRQAFIGLVDAIEATWIGLTPEALRISNRRRATLALYALVNGSPMDACSDAEVEKMIRQLLPNPVVDLRSAIAEPVVQYATA